MIGIGKCAENPGRMLGKVRPFVIVLASIAIPGMAAFGEITWVGKSSVTADLPAPNAGSQQTCCVVGDFDKDGGDDFVVGERTRTPSVVWYKYNGRGWNRYVIDDTPLKPEAGGDAYDIDRDGDLDLVLGQDASGNAIWWWENPYPDFGQPWTRRTIKNSGGRKHHDQSFADYDGDGQVELATWNQGDKKLLLYEIPQDPRGTEPWVGRTIYQWSSGLEREGFPSIPVDIDLDGKLDIVGGGRWFKHIEGAKYEEHIIDGEMTFTQCAAGQLVKGGRPEVVFSPGDMDGDARWYEYDGDQWVAHTLRRVLHGHTCEIRDVDRDGNLDIMIGEMGDPGAGDKANVYIWYGDGQGGFRETIAWHGQGIHEGRFGDFNHDGRLDILLKPYHHNAPRLDILLNTGAAEVSQTQGKRHPNADLPFRHIIIDSDNPTYPHCKAAGDIDGDGFSDVLAASAYGQGLYWYAWPNWTKHRIAGGSFTTDMQVGDVDKDGDLDVIIPRGGTGLVWFENPRPQGKPATTAWKVHRIDAEGAHDLEVGDVDGDGRLDVVVRHGRTRVFLQNSPDSWRKIPIPTGGRGGTALGDLDGDGDLDIAQDGYWLETPADKSAEWRRHEIAAGWPDDCGVHIVDINHDGRMDVLLAPAETTGRLAWYETTDPKNGPWKEHVIAGDVAYIHTFKTVDIDHDGELDVVTAEMEQSAQRRVSIYFNEGRALRWRQQVVGRTGSHNLRLADIGNDGDIDIIGTNHGNYGGDTPVDLWENLTNRPAPTLPLDRWQRHVIDPKKPWGAAFIRSGDLDGDGLRDIVTGGWWYKNPGRAANEWTRQTIGEPLNDAAVVCDFDLDGALDILGTQGKTPAANANFAWARNDGRGNFTVHTNLAPATGDFLQGCTTIFTAYRRREVALSWHRGGQGIQMFTVPKDPVKETWPWRKISDVSQDEQVTAGQIDNNTSMDLLLGTKWLRSQGGKAWTLQTLNPVEGHPDRNRLADLNGDGRLDAVVGFEAINVPGKLAWYEQPQNVTGTWPEHLIANVVGPMSMDVADLDRDGDFDVVVGEHNYKDPATAKLHIFENTDGKGGQWKDHVISVGDEHHDGAILADMDNDGDLDILSIGWRNTRVLLYENGAVP